MANKTLVIANWKMNPASELEADKLLEGIKKIARGKKKTEIVIAPPSPFLSSANYYLNRLSNVSIGAQNMFWNDRGSFTGQVSPLMLKDFGAKYVILGHSELRDLGETDEMINQKIRTALAHKIKPIVCIGESERDENGFYLGFLHRQIEFALKDVSKKDFSSIIFAYEPLWAIGKSAEDAVTPHGLHQMTLYIKKVISEFSSKMIAMKMRIIYGGSVEGSNASALLSDGAINGFLVGHASLDINEFREIISQVEQGKAKIKLKRK